MCDKMCLWGGNPNLAGVGNGSTRSSDVGREHSFQMAWAVTELVLHAVFHRALVSCSQVPCVVKLEWFWHGGRRQLLFWGWTPSLTEAWRAAERRRAKWRGESVDNAEVRNLTQPWHWILRLPLHVPPHKYQPLHRIRSVVLSLSLLDQSSLVSISLFRRFNDAFNEWNRNSKIQ